MVADAERPPRHPTKPANMTSYDGKELAARPISDAVEPIGISLVHRLSGTLSPAAQNVMAHCQQYFSGI